jgi:hypothetical protein
MEKIRRDNRDVTDYRKKEESGSLHWKATLVWKWGTFGYEILHKGKIKELLKIKPFGELQFDCYGIKHTVKIFNSKDEYNSLYWFDDEKGKWTQTMGLQNRVLNGNND